MGTEDDTLGKRILAFIVDAVILGVIGGLLFGVVLAGALTGSGSPGALFGLYALYALASIAYFVVLEAEYGQTLGKRVMDIVVVKEDGGDCDYTASIVRNLLRIVDGQFMYIVGIAVILITDEGQRVGDIAGSTVVVETADWGVLSPPGGRPRGTVRAARTTSRRLGPRGPGARGLDVAVLALLVEVLVGVAQHVPGAVLRDGVDGLLVVAPLQVAVLLG